MDYEALRHLTHERRQKLTHEARTEQLWRETSPAADRAAAACCSTQRATGCCPTTAPLVHSDDAGNGAHAPGRPEFVLRARVAPVHAHNRRVDERKQAEVDYPERVGEAGREWLRTKPFANEPRETARHLIDAGYVIELLDLRAGQRFVELGCGPGWMTRFMARHGLDAHGYDISPAMIEIAREQARGRERRRALRHRRLRAARPRHAFDARLTYDALHHSARPELVLASAHRALKPGGPLLVSEPNWKQRYQGRDATAEYGTTELGYSPRRLKRLLKDEGFDRHPPLPQQPQAPLRQPPGRRARAPRGADDLPAARAVLDADLAPRPGAMTALPARDLRAADGRAVGRRARPRRDPRIAATAESAFDDENLWPAGEGGLGELSPAEEPLRRRRRSRLGAARVPRARSNRRHARPRRCDHAHPRAWRRQPDLMRDVELPSTPRPRCSAERPGSSRSLCSSSRATSWPIACSRASARTRTTRRTSSCGAPPERCSPRTRCTRRPASSVGATPGRERRRASSRAAKTTASGRSTLRRQ